jgi:transposase
MAKTPGNIMPGSIATPGLLSFIFTQKYCDYLPYYRQEAAFERLGIEISRQNMSNWQIQVCKVVKPLLDVMLAHLKTGNVMQMDETTMQVIGEEGRANAQRSYMWLARGGPPDKPVVWYEYHPTRGAQNITHILTGFSGYLQSDGYAGYDTALGGRREITHVGCFAHVRRKFFEAMKAGKTPGGAEAALSQIKGLYTVEKSLRQALKEENQEGKPFTKDDFLERRRQACTPILKAFHEWLEAEEPKVPPSTKLGEAVRYTLEQWPKLVNYLCDAQLTPDNNSAERSIRPFVMGRKNWVMSGSPAGAESSCQLFSLIETAKVNKINPYEYLKIVFERAAELSASDDWSKLLPWNLTL